MARRKPENRVIEVLLLDFCKNLGDKYELVKVRPSYAKNVLLPKQLALLATKDVINTYKAKMVVADKERAKKVADISGLFEKLINDGGLLIKRLTNDKGSLYDKIDTKDIVAEIASTYSINIDSSYLKLKNKISELGEFKVPFKYQELEREILVVVKAEKKETKEDK